MKRALNQAIEVIKKFEGIRHRPYLCPGGILKIGWGSTRNVIPGTLITNEEAQAMLEAEAQDVEVDLRACVKLSLKENQWAALISFAYSIGITRFRYSTMLKKLNGKDRKGAVAEFTRWVYVDKKRLPGLVKRREAERDLFLWGAEEAVKNYTSVDEGI